MYASAHLDLIRAATAERLAGVGRSAAPEAPITPARITTWGTRPGSRGHGAPGIARPPGRPLAHAAVRVDVRHGSDTVDLRDEARRIPTPRTSAERHADVAAMEA